YRDQGASNVGMGAHARQAAFLRRAGKRGIVRAFVARRISLPMDWLQILVLALVQGITEFLPISSSAHLILVPHFFDWPDQGLGFDLAVHLGTLVAVVGYYRRDVLAMARAWLGSFVTWRLDRDARLAWGLILATIPAIIFGLLLGAQGEAMLRTPWIIASTSIVFGILLGWFDWRGRMNGEVE